MPGGEFISKRTRTEFRETLSGWSTLRTIAKLFENEGFEPDCTHDPGASGQRRTLVEQYYCAINFCDPRQVQRLLRVTKTSSGTSKKNPQTMQPSYSCTSSATGAGLRTGASYS